MVKFSWLADSSGEHGLIAAPTDQSTGIQWYNGFDSTTGATGTAVGTGLANTNAIITEQGVGSYAAQLSANLVIGQYSDWYLPSKDELNLMYQNIGQGAVAPLTNVGDFANDIYWSSTESGSYGAWYQYFGEGDQNTFYKSCCSRVRAIRAFVPVGKQVTGAISLQGGSDSAVNWLAPSTMTYKVHVLVPKTGTMTNALYRVYPKGKQANSTSCDSTHAKYPCFEVTVDQTQFQNTWVQLVLNDDAATQWTFSKDKGYVTAVADNLSAAEMLNLSILVRFENPNTNSDAVNCFDYYHFGSVQADMEGGGGSVSGSFMHFGGNIKNDNTYPIVEGALYAKVFRKQTDDSLIHQNGHNLVDQFFVKDHISIPAKGKIPIEFDWQVPSYAISGDYQIAFFFTSAKKFNLLGLSFTDDIVGNIVNFTISGEQKNIVSFNKNTVKIAGNIYRFTAFPPHNDKDKDIPVTAELVNSTDKPQMIRVTWKLYGWDAQSEDNLLNTKIEDVFIESKETKTLQYIDTSREYSVHLLVAEAQYQDTKSLLDIRYVRDGVDKVRLNFLSITTYPLKKNKENTLFSCVHNSGTATVQNNKLTLNLKDQDGNLIHAYTYNGAISSAMMAVKDTFTPTKTYKNFSLEARLYQEGTLVDSATMKYECEKLGETDCPKPISTILNSDQ